MKKVFSYFRAVVKGYGIRTVFLIVSGVCLLGGKGAAEAQTDMAGSKDHPLIGRFQGSWIGGYETMGFDEYPFTSGKVEKPGDNTQTLEGRVTKIAYHVPDRISVLQIFRNFQRKLQESGFELLFECELSQECGTGFPQHLPYLHHSPDVGRR